MKKYFLIAFLFVLGLIFASDVFVQNRFTAIDVNENCEIAVDFNKNLKPDPEEYISIEGITSFCSDENISNNAKNIGFPSLNESIYLQRTARDFFRDTFLNSHLKLYNFNENVSNLNIFGYKIRNDKKSRKIYVFGEDAAKSVLKNGFAVANSEEYKPFENIAKIKSHLEEGKKHKYYLLNKKSLKYHSLTCPFGLKSAKYEFLEEFELPEKAKPCKECLLNNSDQIKNKKFPGDNDKNKITPRYFKYVEPNLEVYSSTGGGILRPTSACASDMCKVLLREINNAKISIDIALYDLNGIPEITEALKNAQKRGVNISAVCDYTYGAENSVKKHFPQAVDDFSKNKTNAGHIMHNKFFIFDGKKVFTGSANITSTCLTGFNANTVILVNNSDFAKIYKNEFDILHSGKFHNAKPVNKTGKTVTLPSGTKLTVFFAPKDGIIGNGIVPYVKKAKKSIKIPVFIITHKLLTQELINAANRGVKVKVITDATTGLNKYSSLKSLRKAGIAVKAENFAGKIHMKTVIIDDEYVFVGSANLTKNADKNNDENTVLIESENIAKHFSQVFDYIFSIIPDKYLNKVPKAESFESIGSCHDCTDNDYDGKIDGADDGCKIRKIH